MGIILNIETATKNCSVSIAKNGKVIAYKEINDGNYSHAEKLHSFISDVVEDSSFSFSNLDAIAVSKGPGSYTGLRIGVSAAKGLCFALDLPLISVNTLESLATSISVDKGLIVPMLDARRMEVYSAIYNSNHHQIRAIEAQVIDEHSFSDELSQDLVFFIGDGASKCKNVLNHMNSRFIDDKFPSSLQMALLSYNKYINSQFEDVAYFEPFYLKDFIVTPSKKKY